MKGERPLPLDCLLSHKSLSFCTVRKLIHKYQNGRSDEALIFVDCFGRTNCVGWTTERTNGWLTAVVTLRQSSFRVGSCSDEWTIRRPCNRYPIGLQSLGEKITGRGGAFVLRPTVQPTVAQSFRLLTMTLCDRSCHVCM